MADNVIGLTTEIEKLLGGPIDKLRTVPQAFKTDYVLIEVLAGDMIYSLHRDTQTHEITLEGERWAGPLEIEAFKNEALPQADDPADDRTIEGIIMELLDGTCDGEDFPEMANSRCQAFQDAGMLTRDAGVVLKLDDGSEFQVSIIQSKRARQAL